MSSYFGLPNQPYQYQQQAYVTAQNPSGNNQPTMAYVATQNQGDYYQQQNQNSNFYVTQPTTYKMYQAQSLPSSSNLKSVTVVTPTTAVQQQTEQKLAPVYNNFVSAGGGGGGGNKRDGQSNNSYDAAVLSVASAYGNQNFQQYPTGTGNGNQTQNYSAPNSNRGNYSGGGGNWRGNSGGGRGGYQGRNNYRGGGSSYSQPQQQFYCEICKISCQGQMTFREHENGSKHQKKEAALKSGSNLSTIPAGMSAMKCPLCEISVTGKDAYTAHITGAKHKRIASTCRQMGKPVPDCTNPVILKAEKIKPGDSVTKVISTPKPNFVAGKGLGTEPEEMETESVGPKMKFVEASGEPLPEDNSKPIGLEYITESYNSQGKAINFHCKLCDCDFSDPHARTMHSKGRRHRLNYKSQVDPSIVVESQPNKWNPRGRGYRGGHVGQSRDMYNLNKDMRMAFAVQKAAQMKGDPYFVPALKPNERSASLKNSIDTEADKHLGVKHTAIYPNEEQLRVVQYIVTNCERALKSVSDKLAEEDCKVGIELLAKKAEEDKKNDDVETDQPKEESMSVDKPDAEKSNKSVPPPVNRNPSPNVFRQLKGVMRVGPLAKGLLLSADLNMKLVVCCANWPTDKLLVRVAESFKENLEEVAATEPQPEDAPPAETTGDEPKEEKVTPAKSDLPYFSMKICESDGCIRVTRHPKRDAASPVCTITLTSSVIREGDNKESNGAEEREIPLGTGPLKLDGHHLNRAPCLEALALLRHAKWFQAKLSQTPAAVMVVRILRDLCSRVQTWGPFPHWAIELLIERCISPTMLPNGPWLSPSQILKRSFEAVASGLMLPPMGPGLFDPCEKIPTDSLACLTTQQREDITASAQHALRLMAFHQIHKVLGIERIQPTADAVGGKRKIDEEEEEEADSPEKKTKTDEK